MPLLRREEIERRLQNIRESVGGLTSEDIQQTRVAIAQQRSTFYGYLEGIIIALMANAFITTGWYVVSTVQAKKPVLDQYNFGMVLFGVVVAPLVIVYIALNWSRHLEELSGMLEILDQEARRKALDPGV
jgi:tetrahydromethanopterin S-methyltransferase subunit G